MLAYAKPINEHLDAIIHAAEAAGQTVDHVVLDDHEWAEFKEFAITHLNTVINDSESRVYKGLRLVHVPGYRPLTNQ